MSENNHDMDKPIYNCHFELTLDVIGGKWKPIILYYIGHNQVLRYGNLKKCIPSINERMLTKQLRELENDGLIIRKIYKEVPPKVEYSLSKTGKSIMPLLYELQEWGAGYNTRNGSPEYRVRQAGKREDD